MRDEVCACAPIKPVFAQPFPIHFDMPEIFTRGQAGRQLFLHRPERLGNLRFLGSALVAHRLVSAEQRGRNPPVLLGELHGSGNRLDERKSLQFPL